MKKNKYFPFSRRKKEEVDTFGTMRPDLAKFYKSLAIPQRFIQYFAKCNPTLATFYAIGQKFEWPKYCKNNLVNWSHCGTRNKVKNVTLVLFKMGRFRPLFLFVIQWTPISDADDRFT